MSRLTNNKLEEIAKKYNLVKSNIDDYIPHVRGSRVKIGFQFIIDNGNTTDFISFYGKLSEYKNVDIELIIEKALTIINKNRKNDSSYYLIRLSDEKFIKRYDEEFYQSDFYINVIKKYYDNIKYYK